MMHVGEYQRSVKELLEVEGEQLYPLECSRNQILCMITGSDFPEKKRNEKILYHREFGLLSHINYYIPYSMV